MLSLPAGCLLTAPSFSPCPPASCKHTTLTLRGLQEPQCVHWDIACILQARAGFSQQRILSILLQSTHNTNTEPKMLGTACCLKSNSLLLHSSHPAMSPPTLLEHRCCHAPTLCSVEENVENCIVRTKDYKARGEC